MRATLLLLASLVAVPASADDRPSSLARQSPSFQVVQPDVGQARQISQAPAATSGDSQDVQPSSETLSDDEILNRINQLEAELIRLRNAARLSRDGKKIALPKNGLYVQGDVGLQQREFAGANGITNLIFNPGFYGGVGLGYRYDRNFRFSFEFDSMNNSVDKIRPGIPLPVVDPVLGVVGANGPQFKANGNVRLDMYTFNVYYDLNGFGFERRFRPYIGAGVGLMTSTISGLQPSFFPAIGVNRELNGVNTQPTLNVQAGISYLYGKQTEFFLGAQYIYTSTFLFQNTDFGTLMPNGARNWVLKTGARYTF
jgi:opacity protein-like surface antigen